MISEKIGTVRQWGNLNYDQALTRKHDAQMFENLEFCVNSIDFFFSFSDIRHSFVSLQNDL